MRDYAIIKPAFWLGKTGKTFRGDMQAQLVAIYLMTSPHSSMIGVYHCPIMYIAYETGMTPEGASKGLRSLIDSGFCTFDRDTDTVFVVNMLRYQVGDNLSPKDNRVKAIKKAYLDLPETNQKQDFACKYWELLGIEKPAEKPSYKEAPSKPLRSQDQDQDQEQEHKRACAEVKKTSPLVIELPLVGTDEAHQVTADDVLQYQPLYPAIDVMQELRNMRGWLLGNPKNRKTKGGIKRFITHWLSRAQNQSTKFAPGYTGQPDWNVPMFDGIQDRSFIDGDFTSGELE